MTYVCIILNVLTIVSQFEEKTTITTTIVTPVTLRTDTWEEVHVLTAITPVTTTILGACI